jgi:hypothetical protein
VVAVVAVDAVDAVDAVEELDVFVGVVVEEEVVDTCFDS